MLVVAEESGNKVAEGSMRERTRSVGLIGED